MSQKLQKDKPQKNKLMSGRRQTNHTSPDTSTTESE